MASDPLAGGADSFTPEELARSASYQKRLRRAVRFGALGQMGVLALWAIIASDISDTSKLATWPWAPTLVVVILIVRITSIVPTALGYAYRTLRLDRSFGLSSQTASGWLADCLKVSGISLASSLAVGLILWLALRYMTNWWLGAWAILAVWVLIRNGFLPQVLRLVASLSEPPPEVIASVERLAKQMGTSSPRVVIADLGQRRTVPNAMVAGIGPFQRMIILEPLLGFPEQERDVVLAHELAHRRNRDVSVGAVVLSLSQILPVVGFAFTAEVLGFRLNAPVSVVEYPVYAFGSFLGLQYSALILLFLRRRQERRADRWALDATRNVAAFRSMIHRIATANLAQLRTERGLSGLGCTHPAPAVRMAMANTWNIENGVMESDAGSDTPASPEI